MGPVLGAERLGDGVHPVAGPHRVGPACEVRGARAGVGAPLRGRARRRGLRLILVGLVGLGGLGGLRRLLRRHQPEEATCQRLGVVEEAAGLALDLVLALGPVGRDADDVARVDLRPVAARIERPLGVRVAQLLPRLGPVCHAEDVGDPPRDLARVVRRGAVAARVVLGDLVDALRDLAGLEPRVAQPQPQPPPQGPPHARPRRGKPRPPWGKPPLRWGALSARWPP